MPIEFQGAAYRFGDSMVRPSYRANLAGGRDGAAFFGMVFDPALVGSDRDDLVGGFRSSRRFIGWQTFFDFGDGAVKPTRGSTPRSPPSGVDEPGPHSWRRTSAVAVRAP